MINRKNYFQMVSKQHTMFTVLVRINTDRVTKKLRSHLTNTSEK